MGTLYWDWGVVGALFASWLLGYASTLLYLRAKQASYWGHVLMYGLVGYGVFLSPFMYFYRFNMLVKMIFVFVLGFVVLRGGVLVDRRRHG